MKRITSCFKLPLLAVISVCALTGLHACKGQKNKKRGTCRIQQVTVINNDAQEDYEDFQLYNNGLLKEIDYQVIDHEEPSHKSSASIRFFYDDSLRLILTEHLYNQQLGGKYRLKWQGTRLLEIRYENKEMKETERHEYIYEGEQEKPVRMQNYENGQKSYHCDYSYDEKGNRISEVCYAENPDGSGYIKIKRVDYTYSSEKVYPDSYKLSGIHYLWSHGSSVAWPLHNLMTSIRSEWFDAEGESSVREMVFTYQQDVHNNLTEIIYSGGGKFLLKYSCQ